MCSDLFLRDLMHTRGDEGAPFPGCLLVPGALSTSSVSELRGVGGWSASLASLPLHCTSAPFCSAARVAGQPPVLMPVSVGVRCSA